MSVGSEFHRSDAATGKERRPMVVSRTDVARDYATIQIWRKHSH